ncbi:MAG: phosphatidylserine/phosphatidylglycerophosphate/cardiolipin synthase-like enzyme [Candidatus Omnitrophota bacterium]|jgi:phosphatidylserine/phosphatidylglycerophosphate/cardiolipin synthase-like enzyme
MSGISFAYEADVVSLPTSTYFETVIGEIQNAKESVVVSMYQASIYEREQKSKPFLILKELVAAKERGLDVWILLDQNINYTDGVPRSKWKGRGRNQAAYQFLKKNGIAVSYDYVVHNIISIRPQRTLTQKSLSLIIRQPY